MSDANSRKQQQQKRCTDLAAYFIKLKLPFVKKIINKNSLETSWEKCFLIYP